MRHDAVGVGVSERSAAALSLLRVTRSGELPAGISIGGVAEMTLAFIRASRLYDPAHGPRERVADALRHAGRSTLDGGNHSEPALCVLRSVVIALSPTSRPLTSG